MTTAIRVSRSVRACLSVVSSIWDKPAIACEPPVTFASWNLGAGHRLDAAAINQLAATVDLVGGHIRNAVLAAAVLARGARRPIELDDLVEGLLIEYREVGRSAPPELAARRKR